MGVRLLTPQNKPHIRSAPRATGVDLLTGRFGVIDVNGQVALPGSGSKKGCYLIYQGTRDHIGTRTDFGAGPSYASTSYVDLPAVTASGEVAIVRGAITIEVGPEGFDPAASYAVGDEVEADAVGRLVVDSTPGGDEIGRVEVVTTDGSGNVILLRVALFGI